jgi:hypothetical protein
LVACLDACCRVKGRMKRPDRFVCPMSHISGEKLVRDSRIRYQETAGSFFCFFLRLESNTTNLLTLLAAFNLLLLMFSRCKEHISQEEGTDVVHSSFDHLTRLGKCSSDYSTSSESKGTGHSLGFFRMLMSQPRASSAALPRSTRSTWPTFCLWC